LVSDYLEHTGGGWYDVYVASEKVGRAKGKDAAEDLLNEALGV